MLKDSKAFSSFSVNDTERAKEFYNEVLGLELTQDNEMGGILTIQISGAGHVMVYPKPDHTPATFTVLNFMVDDIEATVKGLKEKGVAFESYDSDYLRTGTDGISRGGGPLIAWFKDPAGNILSVIQQDES